MTENRPVVLKTWEKRFIIKGRKRTFSGNGTVLYLNCGGIYITVYTLQNSMIYTHLKE